jgi:hypothetical protein
VPAIAGQIVQVTGGNAHGGVPIAVSNVIIVHSKLPFIAGDHESALGQVVMHTLLSKLPTDERFWLSAALALTALIVLY